jgi:hypothetical protein
MEIDGREVISLDRGTIVEGKVEEVWGNYNENGGEGRKECELQQRKRGSPSTFHTYGSIVTGCYAYERCDPTG